MNSVRNQTLWSLVFLTAAIFLLTVSTAHAVMFSVSGFNNTGVTATVDATYNASSATDATITLMVMNTTPSPPTNGAITGLAFNVPTTVTGISSFGFSSTDPEAKDFVAFLIPDNVDAGPFEGFDLGITNGNVNYGGAVSPSSLASLSKSSNKNKPSGEQKAYLKAQSKYEKAQSKVDAAQAALDAATSEKNIAKAMSKLEKLLAKLQSAEATMVQAQAMMMAADKQNINGGTPSIGIDPGFKGTFTLGLTGTDLDMLNINSFLSLLSEGKNNPAGSEGFIVRFQGVGVNGEGSDFAPPDGEFPPEAIPEPATLLLLGTGLAHLVGFGRKRFARG